jgi:DNA polymerase III alpha subunit
MDIDIDFADRQEALAILDHRIAAKSLHEKHNTGVYFHEIPHDCNNIATINYKEAQKRGYFKLDFLNVHFYKDIKSEEHLQQLRDMEPNWDLLEHVEFTNMLFQLNGHGELVKQMKPRSIEQLAAVISLIRPGKKHLVGKPWDVVFQEVWSTVDDTGYAFKKSHSIAYALAIVVQINLICSTLIP